jgi:hypothetical protein
MFDTPTFQSDATEAARYRLTPQPTPTLRERMASVLVTLTQRGRDVLPADLEREGFKPAEIAAHLPAATKLADEKLTRDVHADVAGYDREERIRTGALIIRGLMPDPGTIHVALRSAGYATLEVGDLWPELIARAADEFDASMTPQPAPRAA